MNKKILILLILVIILLIPFTLSYDLSDFPKFIEKSVNSSRARKQQKLFK
nr:hypothetical protein [Nanoarchaeota archaeon]